MDVDPNHAVSPEYKGSWSTRAFVFSLTKSISSFRIFESLFSDDGKGDVDHAPSAIGWIFRDLLAMGVEDELVSVNEDLSMKTRSISRVRLIRSADMMTSSIAAGLGESLAYLQTSKSSSLAAVSLFMLLYVRRRVMKFLYFNPESVP